MISRRGFFAGLGALASAGAMKRPAFAIPVRAASAEEWTPDRIQILKALYKEGYHSPVIAARLNELTGARFTRSAVIGKICRLGLIGSRRRG